MLLAGSISAIRILELELYEGEERVFVWRMRTERDNLTDEYAVTGCITCLS